MNWLGWVFLAIAFLCAFGIAMIERYEERLEREAREPDEHEKYLGL